MRLVAMSDIHGFWNSIKEVPDGDVLIIAGDTTGHGTLAETMLFAEWVKKLPHEHKLMVAGNHDLILDVTKSRNDPDYAKKLRIEAIGVLADAGITYLEGSPWAINDVKFYGTPWMPNYYNWAFMMDEDAEELRQAYQKIPADTEVLITHCPPYGVLDDANDESKVGSQFLLERVDQLKDLKAHFFGHIHEGHGQNPPFYNVAMCDANYNIVNPVTVVDVDHES